MYTVDSLTKNLLSLSPGELETLFQLFTDNAELLNKVIPGTPLLTHILTNSADTSNSLFYAYNTWKDKQS